MWHKIPVHLSFPPDSSRIPLDFGQINLALEDLILTYVPQNLTEFAESGGFRKMRPVWNGKQIRNAQPSRCGAPWQLVDAGDSHGWWVPWFS